MNSNEKKNSISIGTPGAAALMVIFAVLCIAVFAILSLSTVLADARLAKASYQAVDEYYAADAKAEEIVAEYREQKDLGTHSFTVLVSETRELQVIVNVQEDGVEVRRWRTKYIGDWNPDDSMSVWTGE